MFKRFTCLILSFVLLLALVPAGAMTASAASTATSDKAITILKAIEPFDNTCNPNGEIGYGTPCTDSGKHGVAGKEHTIREEDADIALRKALKDLDTELNKFASNNGISLSQNQHDAMVLFTFRNGKAWMNGTDELRTAVIQGTKGNAFINAMINWNNLNGQIGENYCKVLANMYLNGKYSSTAPSNYVQVVFHTNGGTLKPSKTSYYYDTNLSESVLPTPTKTGFRFAGWLTTDKDRSTLINKIPTTKAILNVYASWQGDNVKPGVDSTNYDYRINSTAFSVSATKIYDKVNGTEQNGTVAGKLESNFWYVDSNNVEWLHILQCANWNGTGNKYSASLNHWIKLRDITPGASGTVSSGSSGGGTWIPVTVTNAYINVREKANIFGTKIGTVYAGEQYWVAATEQNGIWLWGLIYGDKGEVGWVALMYTDYDEVLAGYGSESSSSASANTVVATAVITAKAYVNVRDGAGTQYNIVSALRKDEEVDLYEIKYVNGQQWGRCNAGWFSLAYADVSAHAGEYDGTDVGFMSYVFDGTIVNPTAIRKEVDKDYITIVDGKPAAGEKVIISNIVASGDNTWGKIWSEDRKTAYGWATITMPDTTDPSGYGRGDVEMTSPKFTSVAEVSVREDHQHNAKRLDSLATGTEVTVKRIVADDETVWGYTEGAKYKGWVNLAQRYFARSEGELKLEEATTSDSTIVKLGEVINAPEVNIRNKATIFGTKVGTLPNGTIVEVIDGPVNGSKKTGWYELKVNFTSSTGCWIRGDYLNVYDGPRSSITYGKSSSEITSPDGTQAATGRGMVANTYGGVNVRTAPGTANTQLTKLLPGTEVTILEVTMYGSTKWGKITLTDGRTGWVCMDYIAMMDYDDLPASSVTVTEKAVYTGHIKTISDADQAKLNKANATDTSKNVIVYATTNSEDNNIVRYLAAGDDVTVHELLTATEYENVVKEDNDYGTTTQTKTSYWARINDGYIKLPQYTVELDAVDENVYTVTGTELLKVREDAGADKPRLEFDLKKYEQVRVTELKIVEASVWGRIEYDGLNGKPAWISLAYCDKGAVSAPAENTGSGSGEGGTSGGNTVQGTVLSTGNTGKCNYMGKIIGQYNEVNVRKEPSANAEKVTDLKKGSSVTITETTLIDGRSWGYCGTGWINLVYVDLTPVGITAIDAKVIATDNTLCYESSETGAKVVGSYASRAVVNIYEEMNGMYKTDMGWVAKNNFL